MQQITPTGVVRWLRYPSSQLSQRALHAAVWTFGSKGLERVLGYARIIILARLLSPVDFGLMGVGLIAISILQSLTQPGLEDALVQRKGKIDEYLNILFTVTLCRVLVIAGILALAAPLVAGFFKAPDARLVIQVMAGALVIRGFENPGTLHFRKDLEFHKKTLSDVLQTVAEIATAIAFAIILHNVWALVFGYLARNVAQVAVSYWIHPYRPWFSRQMGQAKELFAFGRWVYLTRVLNFVSNQADSVMLAKLLGPVTLGFYQMAQRTSSVPLMEIPRGVSTVAFPVYSKLQDNLEKLRRAYLRTIEAVASLSLPLTVTIVLLGRDFVVLVLGENFVNGLGEGLVNGWDLL